MIKVKIMRIENLLLPKLIIIENDEFKEKLFEMNGKSD